MRIEERLVPVMGTTAHVIVTGAAPSLADAALDRLAELEARWSRFRPDSEISAINDRPGVPVLVSRDTYLLVTRAIEGWRMTAGRFDPTLVAELRAAGYDRSFELVASGGSPAEAPGVHGPGDRDARREPRPGAGAITADPVVGAVMVPGGVELDPGGIGKGLAADLVVEQLLGEGAAGAIVSVGGDLRAEGVAPGGDGWIVAVADPADEEHLITTVRFDAGAVASTWRTRRTWIGADGTPRHHIVDPATGTSAITGVAGVTVVSGAGWHAEVLAKAAFLAGPASGAQLLVDHGVAGLVVADDGSTIEAGDLARFTG